MSDFDKKHVVNVSIPHKNTLQCIICEVDFMKIRNFPMKSSYYWQILKCRMIIKIIQEVIASPISGTTGVIYVIAPKKLIENDKLKTQLQNLDVLYGKSQEITADMYTMCLNYTIQYRIASLWNKVGQYYVHGFEFDVLMKEFDALEVKITINDENAQFHFYATKIKIPFIQLEDFGLLNSLIAEFLADDDGIINLTKYYLLVRVLPSMKTGRVISVFKKIPSHCPLKSYNQLHKYWIDMYDYHLPQTDEGIMYYEIKFLSGTSSFIYPSVCVVTGSISSFPSINASNTISQFINDLCNTSSKICNKQLGIYNNKEGQENQLISSGNNTGRINIQNHNCFSLPRNKELIMNNMVDKYFNHGSEHITRYGCDTSINLYKSIEAMTSPSVKRDREDFSNQSQPTCNKLMKFKRSKQTNVISSNNSLMMENKTYDIKIKATGVDEYATSFFKETDPCHMSYKLQVKNNTPVNLTLKQKLLNAMSTTKFGNNIDIRTKHNMID